MPNDVTPVARCCARHRVISVRLVAVLLYLTAAAVQAQTAGATRPDSGKTVPARADSVKRVPPPRLGGLPASLISPISPKRAFLSSLALPGYGQSRLDRGTSGAFFATIEFAALAMVRRSQADVREARRFQIDTLPLGFDVVAGVAQPSGRLPSSYGGDLVRTRRLQVEDWLAVLAFNHLLSAADAFVSAQLFEVPVSVAIAPNHRAATIVATLRW